MIVQFQLDLSWIVCGVYGMGAIVLAFGIFSTFCPKHSIFLYEWLMARLNWRVSPIDEGREVRNTRFLGIILILLILIGLGVLIGWRI